MKRFLISLIASVSLFSFCSFATTHTTNFVASEGFTEGNQIAGVGNWTGQVPWIAKDVNGSGYATNGVDFNRAVLWTNQKFNVGDSYTLTSVLSLEDSSQVNTKTDMFSLA